jgi:hypothetical protein
MPTTNPRIAAIQKLLDVPETGVFDIPTAKKVLETAGKPNTGSNLVTLIHKVQAVLNINPTTGFFGPVSLGKLEGFLAPKPIPVVPGATLIVSRKALDMIVAYEVSSKENYTRKLQSPILPAGASGITIGIGYDLGHNSKDQITADWAALVPAATLALMLAAAGLKGGAAQPALSKMKHIKIPFESAMDVYYHTTVPRYASLTRKAFTGIEKLPPDAQGAILSLVFNRGASTKVTATDKSRQEMANMIPLVKAGDLKGIAAEFRKMKRLWQGKPGLKGLITRREKEAVMIENATFNILPEDQVAV